MGVISEQSQRLRGTAFVSELLLLRRTLLHTSAQCGSNEPSHSSNRSVYTFLRTHSMPHHFGITAIFGGFHHGGAGPRRHPCGRVEVLAEWLVAARCQWGYLGAVAPEEVRYAPRYRLMVCGLCRSPERHRLESRYGAPCPTHAAIATGVVHTPSPLPP